ncbi:putative repeat protein (TIGR02543 family) [Dysgonomonas sp. PFB1-18]|uniref:InlB B-repeat-containing protein n=1 Tax=unclassified Dysgonomonas TaxID=2630389 RepID=UPI00247617C2|nr:MULTISPECIES: InlB B-repeat-containing protein [unclassified Dysgonomonas]MDH6311074.1 putative repeat protein (TIGR02543 family) [Dysgonomonas sp. PF1-14]MDH6340986.1 putative repeat protein (TIGR02543 family) [Dysgonomonas sp. PF1-16]MDH6382541.1 putative repeat protein (TIGR02543 family) [Dysgonomonas sp. PFB1-18]MDH6399925.1 putative repeat protein (TIGR02543 family) [Dysgonomonas sp. PF1-23]
MKKLAFIFIILSTVLFSCNRTDIDGVDLDFEIESPVNEMNGFVGKPITFTFKVQKVDANNNYPMEFKITTKSGKVMYAEVDTLILKKDVYNKMNSSVISISYVPTETISEDFVISIKNQLVEKKASIIINTTSDYYSVYAENFSDKPLIDKRQTFDLIIKEAEVMTGDSIVSYAKVVQGTGEVYNGEVLLNNQEEIGKTRLVAGRNKITYLPRTEGESVIRFFFVNKWNNETYADVKTKANLPEWNIETESDTISTPINDKTSFTINIKEADIFEENQYTASYRMSVNMQEYNLNINSSDVKQGSEFTLKNGSNVSVFTPKEEAMGVLDLYVKDKYKQEKTKRVVFVVKKPVKPIIATIDKSSVSVNVNQEATFNLSLSELNYTGLFDVQLEQTSGSGSFSSGTKLLFSEGTHKITYIPATQGSHTFKITVTDGNNQTKEINVTVQATISPLNISLSAATLNLIQGEKGQVSLTTSETNYSGQFVLSYSVSGTAHKFDFGGTSIGVGGSIHYTGGTNIIYITGSTLGTSNYTISVTDDFKQKKELPLKVVVKGKVSLSAGSGGTVTGGGNFEKGQEITVTAKSDTGYGFGGWYDNGVKISDNPVYTFVVTESINLEARFVTNKYTVTATAETGGTVTGSGSYEHGKQAVLKASVNTGYTFAGWYNGATRVSTSAEYTVTVTKDVTLVAKFTANSYNITVSAQTGGTATGGGSFKHDATATVKATANTGYTFAGWYNGGTKVSDAPTYTFTVTGTVSLEARFTAGKHAITVNSQPGGKVSGGGNFDYNSNITITAIPDANYEFIGWYEGETKVSESSTYNFTVTKERTLEARFKVKEMTLTVTAGTGGTVSGGGTYEYNSTVTIKATAETGYAFEGWYENGTKISSNISYVVKVTGNRSIEAKFTANKLNVIVNAATGGTATGSGAYSYNSNVTIVATPTANYTFDGWYDGAAKIATSLSYTFKIVKETTLEARFTPKKYNVSTSGANGTQTGDGSYDYGTNATVKANANSTYKFTGWYEGNTQVSTSNPYTFKVEKDRILEAKYEQIKYTVTATAGNGGTVSGSGTFVVNADVTLKATPDTGSTFNGWYNGSNLVSNSATYTFKVTENITLQARFNTKSYSVSASAETGGTVTGAGSYDHGKQAVLKASVNTGYTFAGWYNGATRVSTALEYTITVTEDVTLIAKFTANSYNITVSAQTGGTATGGGSFKHDATATVKATVNTGYVFAGWYSGSTKVSDAPTYTFTVTGAVSLEARFTANKYNVVANAQTGGTATGSGTFSYGVTTSVTAKADAGYTFTGWYNDNTKVSEALTYTFTVSNTITLEARFTINKFNIIVNAQTGGTATGGGTYNYGTNVTIKATVNAGYTFTGWYNGSTKVSDALSYTFAVSQATTYEARFTVNKFNVIVNAQTGGSVSGAGVYDYNSNASVRATASSNYTFSGWYENGTQVSISDTYTFKVLKETTLEARFTIKKHAVTLSGVNGTQTGGGTFDYGTNATIKAVPNTNYTFTGWYENNSQVSTSNPYTFAVQKDRIIEARYSLAKRAVTLATPTGGTVTGAGSFDHGSNVTVKAVAITGYTFDGWYNGSTKLSSDATYVFSITANVTLTAKFNINKYVVTIQAATGGTATGAGTYNHGTSVTVKAVVNPNYAFDGWYIGSTKVASTNEYSFTITNSITLTPKFKLNEVLITVKASTGGNASGGASYAIGSNATVTATPDSYHKFDGWYEGNSKVSSSTSYSFTVTSTRTLEARFIANIYFRFSAKVSGRTSSGHNAGGDETTAVLYKWTSHSYKIESYKVINGSEVPYNDFPEQVNVTYTVSYAYATPYSPGYSILVCQRKTNSGAYTQAFNAYSSFETAFPLGKNDIFADWVSFSNVSLSRTSNTRGESYILINSVKYDRGGTIQNYYLQ